MLYFFNSPDITDLNCVFSQGLPSKSVWKKNTPMNRPLFDRRSKKHGLGSLTLSLEPELGELESAYREANLGADIDQMKVLVTLGICFVLVYAVIDYQLFGLSITLLALYLVRTIFIGISIITLVSLRHADTRRLDRLALIWVAILAGSMLYINSTRSASFFYNGVVDLVILIAFYTALPVPLTYRIAPSLLLSVGEITLLLFFRQDINPIGVRSMIFGILLGNIIGAMVSIRANAFRRSQFIAQYEERQAREEIEFLATTDDLTLVLNRKRFEELAEKEFARFRRYKYPLSFLIIDLDNLKNINDRCGHPIGDQVLKQFGTIFRAGIRKIDLVGRLGGDEFGLLLPEAGGEKAKEIGERLRRICEQEVIRTPDTLIHVTISVGVTDAQPDDQAIESVSRRAYEALHQAKNDGRNQVNLISNSPKNMSPDIPMQEGVSQPFI
jgi:diguanylate cyclase (GGDEF)-like protein